MSQGDLLSLPNDAMQTELFTMSYDRYTNIRMYRGTTAQLGTYASSLLRFLDHTQLDKRARTHTHTHTHTVGLP